MCLTVFNGEKDTFTNFSEEFSQSNLSKEFSQSTPDPLVAEEDIICYKVLEVKTEETGVKLYHSPYYPYTYGKNEVYTEKDFVKTQIYYNERKPTWDPWESRGYITVNYGFHTFYSMELALTEYLYWQRRNRCFHSHRSDYCIMKCVIPKGSRYYRGFTVQTEKGDQVGYCSESIKLIEVMLPLESHENQKP